jgi:hypothetical protein
MMRTNILGKIRPLIWRRIPLSEGNAFTLPINYMIQLVSVATPGNAIEVGKTPDWYSMM